MARASWRLVAISLAALASGCAGGGVRSTSPGSLGQPVAETCPAALYFPAGAFASEVADYGRYLSAMEEPSLWCGVSDAEESYRLLWIRSFHDPVAVRVSRLGSGMRLEAAVIKFAGGYEQLQVRRRVDIGLAPGQWAQVRSAMQELDFWRMPTSSGEAPGSGGSHWIIEGRSKGRYHVVDRWSGHDGTREAGLTLLGLAGLTRGREPIY